MYLSPSQAAACSRTAVRIAWSSHSSDKRFSLNHFARTRYPHQKSRFTEICQGTPMENMSLYTASTRFNNEIWAFLFLFF